MVLSRGGAVWRGWCCPDEVLSSGGVCPRGGAVQGVLSITGSDIITPLCEHND